MSHEESLFERLLAQYCAPVLKKKKIANMFHVEKGCFHDLEEILDKYNTLLNSKGLYLQLFQQQSHRVTVYVYHKDHLTSILHQPEIKAFLSRYQYTCKDVDACFRHLNDRLLLSKEYPHEIGIFLGYPLCDVIGFIENRPYQAYGYWKVYENSTTTKRLFSLYDRCTRLTFQSVLRGQSIIQLVS